VISRRAASAVATWAGASPGRIGLWYLHPAASGDVVQPFFAVHYWPHPVEDLSSGAAKAL
jgi:hypothetical protein